MKKAILALTILAGGVMSAFSAQAAQDVSATCTQSAYELAGSMGVGANDYGKMAQICIMGYQRAKENPRQVISDLKETADNYRSVEAKGNLGQPQVNAFYGFIKMYSLGASLAGMSKAELSNATHWLLDS